MKFSVSDTVGPYRILEELGRGGMGRVFKVEHSLTQRMEAMKVLEGGRPEAPAQAERSLREIRIQARLEHDHIAAIHNAFWADDDLVLVMELIEGCSLRRLLEVGRISMATAIDYACQALSALAYAHAHGVIHRDVSPSNMMVTPNGVLKLTDFGLAKGPADARVSQSGVPLGSPYYMSPEQVQGTDQADARSDIYSLGAVLYELVTGKKPFEGESVFSIMVEHVERPPAPPIQVEPSLPQALNNAILRSLAKDPSQRFASADEFRRALIEIPDAGIVSISRPRAWQTRAAAALALLTLAQAGSFRAGWRPAVAKAPDAVVVNAIPVPTIVSAPAENSMRQKRQRSNSLPQKRNPLRRAMSKLWPFGRPKKSSDSIRTVEPPRYSDRD